MNLKDFKVKSEAYDSFHLTHPSGKHFTVDKKKLSPKALKEIQKLCGGGEVQKFDDGGGVDSAPQEQAAETASHGASGSWAEEPQSAHAPMQEQATNPVTQAPPANPLVQGGAETDKLFQTEQKSAQDYAKSMEQVGKAQQMAFQEQINQMQKMQTPQQIADSYKAKDEAFLKQVVDSKIDPNRYMHNQSTGSKILAGIAMGLSGMGAGPNGTNLAYDHIQRAINNDIDAQKNDQSKSMNLWKMNRESMRDDLQAHIATQNQLLTMAQAKVAMAGAGAQSAEAKLKASQLVAQIQAQLIQNRQRLGLLQGGMQDGASGADPTVLLQGVNAPPEHIKKALDEVEAFQNTARMGDSIMKAFEQATKENTVMKTGAGMLRTPGSVYALHQALQPTFKDLESTVRQAAMDNTFKNITPAPGDSEHTIQTKRQALKEYLQSKSSAPTFRYLTGVPLSSFASTSMNPAARFTGQDKVYYDWAKAHPDSDVAQAFFKKHGISQ